MPATRAAAERHYTEDERDMGETCSLCSGEGLVDVECSPGVRGFAQLLKAIYGHKEVRLDCLQDCLLCNGTGAVSPERAAEDAADLRDDLLTELRADREAGR